MEEQLTTFETRNLLKRHGVESHPKVDDDSTSSYGIEVQISDLIHGLITVKGYKKARKIMIQLMEFYFGSSEAPSSDPFVEELMKVGENDD